MISYHQATGVEWWEDDEGTIYYSKEEAEEAEMRYMELCAKIEQERKEWLKSEDYKFQCELEDYCELFDLDLCDELY